MLANQIGSRPTNKMAVAGISGTGAAVYLAPLIAELWIQFAPEKLATAVFADAASYLVCLLIAWALAYPVPDELNVPRDPEEGNQ